ncbi:hypothetical protein H9Y05_02015 [Crocinitomicaceae bacterium CZZ-1]|uniref:Uncharacterized protein n=1 Tax=Taishania pollutisoli TaxID=2766479 RepID=A0A8J6PDC8_9FLAO|nr:hypothetical protein [Taishania pollutisoli]MBC9811240.1 hypothetical protein [Taishania pollutisoli]MBX2947845.1 hypothetical protein [Crocinitomicaceae bacterium]NGF75023.1 hypothetical protein [Fluviicola sp. SGL-29]
MKLTRLILVICLIVPFFSEAQTIVTELKKKNYGVYKGEIPSYIYSSDTSLFTIDATPIEVQVSENAIAVTIGKLHKKGSYHILFKDKNYYVLDAFFEGDILTERIVLYEKTKSMIREGSYPQPNALLKKAGR